MINLHKSKDGKFYFTVTAKNGKVLVTSETYNTRRAMKGGYLALANLIFLQENVVNDFTKNKK